MESNRHRYCTKYLLRLQTTYFRKITGDDFNRWHSNCNRKQLRQLQIRVPATKKMTTGPIPGMPEVNRQLKDVHLLGEICQLSSCN